MAIIVWCKCGKRLRAPNVLSGQKAKCPGCGDHLRVPAGGEAGVLADTAPTATYSDEQVAGWLVDSSSAKGLVGDFAADRWPSTSSPSLATTPAVKSTAASFERDPEATQMWLLWVGLPVSILLVIVSYYMQTSMDGRAFLRFYFGLILICMVAIVVIRKFLIDVDLVNILGLIVVEGVAAARIVYGISHGMHKFAFLAIGMIAVAFVFLWSRTTKQDEPSPFANDDDTLCIWKYALLCVPVVAALQLVWFVPDISKTVASFGWVSPAIMASIIGIVYLVLGGESQARSSSSWSSFDSGGWFGSSSYDSGGWGGGGCGGGGCGGGGGGCGGCGGD